ncbi:hypothetical protein CBW65_23595 [Tumebacillus avium]|uniref:Cytoplasmic protein n=1 Tax=Tumebacillus avium TaxID=1903704 RepID=A0A1Y0IUP6_9BACL|nr:YwqG family protein [Tumebacillus avium]ARU63669.1 hypothetical protein CBW65_23595 [Tumebacillus avium]
MQNRIELPAALEPYRGVLEKTTRPFLQIKATSGTTSLHHSKFGGHPYLPKTAEHPKDKNGQPMMLLAQLNFEELPHLDPMPKQGILQIFIPFADSFYGLDFDNQIDQKNFRTVYYSDVVTDESSLVTDFSYLDDVEIGPVPFSGEYTLSFQLQAEPVSMNDYRFASLTDDAINFEDAVEVDGETVDMWDVCAEHLSGIGHKIGGYPGFNQEDPRDDEGAYSGYEILLLQIDTDYDEEEDETDIMWGDSGVANFFIKEEDLRNLDFSKVLYNWDCC